MQTRGFVSAVQRSARIETHEHAEQAGRATLTVPARWLSTEADDLAAQLPPGLAECLRGTPEVGRFGLQAFYRRAAEDEGAGCTPEQARQHARAVTAALREAVAAEYRHVLEERVAPGLRRPGAHREPAPLTVP